MRGSLLVPLFAVASCVATEPAPVGERAQAIIGGSLDDADPAVVLVIATNGPGRSFCTGAVVSPHVVLTAAHCVDPAVVGVGSTVQLFVGDDLNDPQQANDEANYVAAQARAFDVGFDAKRIESGHDVGVVIAQNPLSAAPLPMNRAALTEADLDAPVRLVGYGITGDPSNPGTKRQAKTTLTDYNDLLILFSDSQHQTCEGDSGGPALLGRSGGEVIVGVDSFGGQGCMSGAYDTRVDVYAASFVDPIINQYDPPVDMAGPAVEDLSAADTSTGEEMPAAPAAGSCSLTRSHDSSGTWPLALVALSWFLRPFIRRSTRGPRAQLRKTGPSVIP